MTPDESTLSGCAPRNADRSGDGQPNALPALDWSTSQETKDRIAEIERQQITSPNDPRLRNLPPLD